MKVLSLFSGIGGFDLGFQRAGMQVVGMCEIDKKAQAVLTKRFPEATLHTDVKDVHYERGTIDVVCGGFPCQDLSVAGKRRGLAGERSGLWYEFARIIDEAQPKWVVIENVPGLFSSAGGRDFAIIIQWLADRGYGVGWRVLDAQNFGLAQRRKRVFIVASFGTRSGCTVLFEPESLRWDFAKSRSEGKESARATEKRTGANGEINARAGIPSGTINNPEIAKCLTAHGQRLDWESENFAMQPKTFAIQANIIDRQRGGANGTGISSEGVSYTLTAMDRHVVAYTVGYQDVSPTLRAEAKQSLMTGDGAINSPLAIASVNPVNVLWDSTYGHDPARISPDQNIVPTLTSSMGTGGNNVPMIGVRRLTPTECERLQGFPDGWTSGQSDSHRYKQLGNAVAVPVAEWIGRRIMQVDSNESLM